MLRFKKKQKSVNKNIGFWKEISHKIWINNNRMLFSLPNEVYRALELPSSGQNRLVSDNK